MGVFLYFRCFVTIPLKDCKSLSSFGTGSETFFGTKFFSRPVPRLFRYQVFLIPVPISSNKITNSREQKFPGPGRHTLLYRRQPPMEVLHTRQHKKIKTRETLSQEEDSHSLQHGLQADAEPGWSGRRGSGTDRGPPAHPGRAQDRGDGGG